MKRWVVRELKRWYVLMVLIISADVCILPFDLNGWWVPALVGGGIGLFTPLDIIDD